MITNVLLTFLIYFLSQTIQHLKEVLKYNAFLMSTNAESVINYLQNHKKISQHHQQKATHADSKIVPSLSTSRQRLDVFLFH